MRLSACRTVNALQLADERAGGPGIGNDVERCPAHQEQEQIASRHGCAKVRVKTRLSRLAESVVVKLRGRQRGKTAPVQAVTGPRAVAGYPHPEIHAPHIPHLGSGEVPR